MFAKLAFRNVKRQIGNYLIYFITVSITVALMFAVNSVIFNTQLQAYASTIQTLRSALIMITVFVSLIVAFVLGYATSFMLKLRKREFGTYLTLGMTRKNILSIFVLETLIMGLAALAMGILLGLFLYQGLMGILTNLLELNFTFAAYSFRGLLLTVMLVTGIFLLSSITSAAYLKKVSIYKLLHGDKIVEKNVKHPFLWFFVALLSLAAVIGCCLLFLWSIEETFNGGSGVGAMFGSLVGLAISIITFHIGLSKSLVNLMLKNEKYRNRGTNTFTLRQLSGKLGANSLMAGLLAFLIAFAVIGASCSFVQKVSEQAALDRDYPYDVNVTVDSDERSPISMEEGERIIGEYTEILKKIPYKIYTSGNGYLHQFTQWTGEGYENLWDSFMTESDVNRLLTGLGEEPIALNGGFMIVANIAQVMSCDFSDALLTIGGKAYPYRGITDQAPLFSYTYFFAVVPDDAVNDMSVEAECAAYDIKEEKYDAEGLKEALSYSYSGGEGEYTYDIQRCDYNLKAYGKIQRNSSTAIFIIGALYIAVVFVFMAMAILALKTLSGLSEDRQRYGILFRLGVDRKQKNRTLFRQIFSFFFLPFALPMLLSIPTGIVCARIMKLAGYPNQVGEIVFNVGAIAAVMILIYVLYFTATYLIARRLVNAE